MSGSNLIWDNELFDAGERELPKPPRRKRVNHRALSAKRLVDAHKRAKGCLHCRNDEPSVLDFHHIDPETKLYNVSEMVGRGMSIELIFDEIAKCIVLCSNCHRKVERNKNVS